METPMSMLSIVRPFAVRPWAASVRALLAATWLAAGLLLPAWADPPGRVGRIAEVVGPVWQVDHEKGEWVEATRNHPVIGGDRLRTDGDGRAVVQIGSATLRLAGFTEVEWLQLDDDRVRMIVHAGSIGLRVRSAETAREHEVVAPPGRFLPRTAGHFRVDRLDGASAGQSIVGEMVFETDDSRKRVDAGQRFEFWQRGEPPVTYHDTVVATTDDFGLWLLDAERREPREAVATRYVSPEMTGWEDLDRYGRWDRHPSYGAVWLPYAVAPGWAPYRYGRWGWVRPWGWTWIDDMPWGFAPFHYGRWVWWGSGWAWVPGPWVARPVYAPALVGWIGGPTVSIGISIGTGPWVGWVPLAPLEVYRPWYTVTPRHPHYVPPRPPAWRPPPGHPVPHRPAPYANLATPGGVTVVSNEALVRRRPIGERDLQRLDPGAVRRIAELPPNGAAPPPPVTGPQPRPPRPGPDSAPVPAPRVVAPPPMSPQGPERGPRPAPRDDRESRDGREARPGPDAASPPRERTGPPPSAGPQSGVPGGRTLRSEGRPGGVPPPSFAAPPAAAPAEPVAPVAPVSPAPPQRRPAPGAATNVAPSVAQQAPRPQADRGPVATPPSATPPSATPLRPAPVRPTAPPATGPNPGSAVVATPVERATPGRQAVGVEATTSRPSPAPSAAPQGRPVERVAPPSAGAGPEPASAMRGGRERLQPVPRGDAAAAAAPVTPAPRGEPRYRPMER